MKVEGIKDYLQNKNFVMFVISLVFMLGILAFFSANEVICAFIITFILILLMFLGILSVKKILFLILTFYVGFFLTFFNVKSSDALFQLAPIQSEFSGKIISIPSSGDSTKTKFFLEVEHIGKDSVKGKALVTVTSQNKDLSELNIGENIKLNGRLRRPFTSTNPSQFDYAAYLKNFNTFTVIYADDFEITGNSDELKWKFLNKLNTARSKIIKIHSKYLNTPNLEILGGIVFGDDAVSVPDYIKNSFINSGLLHILAASGMNVAFIYTFLYYILKFFKIPFRIRVGAGIIAIIIYTLMTGLGPSVVRAALMLIFVLIGKLIDRDVHSVSLLSFVALLMLIHNPSDINDVSFQLSFLATLGLLTTARTIFSFIPKKIPGIISSVVIIPIIAQIWIIPIQMFYFNTISLYSVFANICSGCLLSVISFCGFISSLFALVPKLGNYICMIFDFFANYLLNMLIVVSDFFAKLPNSIVQTTHPNVIQLVLYYIMLLGVTRLIKFKKFKPAIITTVVISLIIFATTYTPISKDLEIIAFDVQNADSFLVKTPQNKYFFIDSGKAPYKSENTQAKIIMLKYLKDRGIKNIEGVIITHFDNDHSGGAAEIIKNTNVKTLYLNNREQDTRTAKNIFQTAKEINQNIKIVSKTEIIYAENDLTIKVFKAHFAGKDKSNENSTITLLKYKDFETLFMADADAKSFEQVKENIPNNIEVLKVGHHGAFGVVDSNMLNHINNKISLISTGVNNFGHPDKSTLDTLRNTKIYRTDLHNSIKITTNGQIYKIYSYNPHSKKYDLKEELSTAEN